MHCFLAVNEFNCLTTKSVSFCFPLYFFESEKSPQALNLKVFFSAPTGRLDWWMKVSRDNVHKQVNVNLFWKVHIYCSAPVTKRCIHLVFSPGLEHISLIYLFFLFPQRSKLFRANGQNVSYVVSMQKAAGPTGQLCSTLETYCTFQLPVEGKKKVYLSAVNAVGRSNPTEARILLPKGKPDSFTSRLFFDKIKYTNCTASCLCRSSTHNWCISSSSWGQISPGAVEKSSLPGFKGHRGGMEAFVEDRPVVHSLRNSWT